MFVLTHIYLLRLGLVGAWFGFLDLGQVNVSQSLPIVSSLANYVQCYELSQLFIKVST